MANARVQLTDTIWRQVKMEAAKTNTTPSFIVNEALNTYLADVRTTMANNGDPQYTVSISNGEYVRTPITTDVKTTQINNTTDAKEIADRLAARPVPKPTHRAKPRPKTADVKPGEISEW